MKKATKHNFAKLVSVVILLVMLVGNAFATEKLIISQIAQNEADVTVYAQLVNVESNNIVNTTLARESFQLSLNSGALFNPEHMEMFSNSGSGIAYTIVADQSNLLLSYSSVRAKYIKALQELGNTFGKHDYVKMIYAGKEVVSVFGNNNGGFITGDFASYNRSVDQIRDDNVSSKPLVHEAIKLAMDTYHSKVDGLPERHVILVFTNGRDYSTYQIDELLQNENSTPIYIIGIDGGESKKASLDELGKLARASGGQLFDAVRYEKPADAVTRINSWLRESFVLKFKPEYEYFGKNAISWQLSIAAENRELNSEKRTQQLMAVVTPEPTAEPTVAPTDTPKPSPKVTAEPKPAVTATPEPTMSDKLKSFVASPLGIGLIAAVVVIIAVIVFLVMRSSKDNDEMDYEDSDNAANENGDENGFDPEKTLPGNTDKTLPFSNFDPDGTLPQNAKSGITLRFKIDCDGIEKEEVRTFTDSLVMGRNGYDNDLGVSDDKSVSRRQCKIVYNHSGLAVEDCDSVNGTMLNGTKLVAPSRIQHNDKLEFGNVKVIVEVVDI